MSDAAAFTRVAEVSAIARESSLAVDAGGKPLLICHSGGGFFAVANRCSHAAYPLEGGRVRGGWIACPVHGARFDLASGRVLNPPATEAITTYPVRVVDGWVEVAVG